MLLLKALPSLFVALLLLTSCSSPPDAPAPAPPKPPDEAAAIAALKELNQAQANFIRRTRRYAQTMNELIADHLLTGAPHADGYSIEMVPSADAVSYTVKATPSTPEARHFFTDQTGNLHAASGKPATLDSPKI